jgi:hypothetical protein
MLRISNVHEQYVSRTHKHTRQQLVYMFMCGAPKICDSDMCVSIKVIANSWFGVGDDMCVFSVRTSYEGGCPLCHR